MHPMYDYCIIGGGIVGLSTAQALLDTHPGCTVLLLEKESGLGKHQTGHNSGVVHSGIYYEPGSLKADLCRQGSEAVLEFCERHGIPVKRTGKIIVATDQRELERMAELERRAAQNKVEANRLTQGDLADLEPNVRGLGAMLVPRTSSVDYALMCRSLSTSITVSGGQVHTDVEVTAIQETISHVTVSSPAGNWSARRLVVCAGLQADRLARLGGIATEVSILPFRGEYYRLRGERTDIVRRMIYPVPDPKHPFLGVHLTPMVDGTTTVGPNAVLGLAREGYAKGSVDRRDITDIVRSPGFWNLARRNVRTGLSELRNSLSKAKYLELCRRYCPGLNIDDLLPCEAGIRAQAVLRNGSLSHDFLFEKTERTLHVLNAPSPAATSAIPIGQMIARRSAAGWSS